MSSRVALLLCALIGVAAFALVPFVHPIVHEGEAFAAALSGLGIALLSTRLLRTRAERRDDADRRRRRRRMTELSS